MHKRRLLLRKTRKVVRTAAKNSTRATSLTHRLFRYPASMSPLLARQLITSLTRPGNLVLDPFCGGGTTAIEALALRRKVVCSDINPLAHFVTSAKAIPLTPNAITQLEDWCIRTHLELSKTKNFRSKPLVSRGGIGHSPKTHGMLLALRNRAQRIKRLSVRRIALLFTLQVGKLCFDARLLPPTPELLLRLFKRTYLSGITSLREYSQICTQKKSLHPKEFLTLYRCSVNQLRSRIRQRRKKIALVLTSPPYPVTHVLYNRWQIHGRRETDLPYSLLNLRDGKSSAYYTFGDRKQKDNASYFNGMHDALIELRTLLHASTLVVQVIAFSRPRTQLKKYRTMMNDAGYEEIDFTATSGQLLQRHVPNRRWYATAGNTESIAREYVIFHRPKL